ncbi:RVT_1 domain-containing protein/zf-RVT domain-containing protein, partial [Cephalotus follicularis]
PRSSYRPIE